ncbi:MAG: hypothetical protein DRI44_02140 [Chlamydiae bacterium]|nr:MAG: hypothetical protein DRI44_02140 [Chlamydiota bacterium]
MKRLRRYFIAGLVVALPVVATLWLITFLFKKLPLPPEELINKILGGGIPLWVAALIYRTFILISFFVVITLLGAFTTRTVGAKITYFFQKLLERIPLFNRIYKALHQITSALFGPGRNVFHKVAIIEYPRRGIFTLVFITNDTEERFVKNINASFDIPENDKSEKFLNVFLPTTPNPTSGFFLILPVNAVKILDISVEEALKLIISGGAVRLDESIPEVENA